MCSKTYACSNKSYSCKIKSEHHMQMINILKKSINSFYSKDIIINILCFSLNLIHFYKINL